AEAQGLDHVDFSAELVAASARSVEAERGVFDAHMRKLAQDLDVVQQQKAQKEKEIDELKASETRFSDTLKLMSREVQLTRNLYNQKVVPEIEMLRSDRQATDMQGQLQVTRASIVKTQAAIEEASARIATTRATFRAQAEDDLAKSR